LRKKVKRPDKFCEECNKKLPDGYRHKDVVCGQPKYNGTQYSKCQRDRLIRLGKYGNMRIDTTGRKCVVCDAVLQDVQNALQFICKLPLEERQILKAQGLPWRTECEKKNQERNGLKWKKVNRRTKKEKQEEIEFFVGKDDADMMYYAPLKLPYEDNKQRRCLGILSHEDELGEHWFKSKGPHNRVCDKCVEAFDMRELDHCNHDDTAYTLSLRNDRLSKRGSE
jgi:hypothetical protein